MSKKIEKTIEFGGKKLTLQSGKLAQQADGAVLATYGETVVFATVVSALPKQDLGYFPLTVDYQEKLYAGGRIKGSRWVKRDGKPTDEEILTGRLIDRSIRPLFPKEYKNEVQVIVTVVSVDLENDPSVVASIAVSAALAASTIPWAGPVSIMRVGLKDGKYSVNPIDSEKASSSMDLVVTTTKDAVLMIEAGAKEVSEKEILGGVEFACKEGKKLIEFINEFALAVGKEKQVVVKEKRDASLEKKVKELAIDKIKAAIKNVETESFAGLEELKKSVAANFEGVEAITVPSIVEEFFKKEIRSMILAGKRPDGRKNTEIRPISVEVGTLPRTHGSAVFSRGQTQVLTIATLGTRSLGQLIETAEGEEEKRYIHHYSMPPFSSGETGRVGAPNRREIGHGALAEKALIPVLPSADSFPYTVHVVSEVMSSNGSTSMASTCGSTLSLMDAGVPITSPVAGIAMGVIVESKEEPIILTDIAGLEDFNGDMDFKIAGTAKGITAIQLDVKNIFLTSGILGKALAQAKDARVEILGKIIAVIAEPRKTVSVYAPKIKVVKIDPSKIGEVVGSGGKVIKKIIAETGAQVEVEDDGTVNISATDAEALKKAVDWVEAIVKEVKAGEIYEGTVKRIQPFGAFVEILPGKEGMVHVSDMGREEFVNDPNDVVKVGEKVQVRVKEVDDMHRINLSMNMDPTKDKPKAERGERRGFGGGGRRDDRGGRGGFTHRGGPGFSRGGGRRDFSSSRGRSSFGRRDGGDDRRGGGFRRRDDGERSGGPHFPTSRLVGDRDDRKRFNE